MSLKKKAAQVRAAGNKRGDSVLAHITPEEAALLKARGGAGVTDPDTGLLHFFDSNTGNEEAGNDTSMGSGFAAGGFADGMGPAGTPGFGSVAYGDGTGSGAALSYTPPEELTFNPAMDSQLANLDGGFAANSDFAGYSEGYTGFSNPPTDDSLSSMFESLAAKKAKSLASNYAISQVSKAVGVPASMIGMGLNMATAKGPEAQGKAFGSGFGSIAGGLLGSLAGPAGAVLGSQAGSKLGESLGSWEASRNLSASDRAGISQGSREAAAGSRGGDFDLGALFTGGLGLYQGYQAGQDARESAGVARQQTQSLQDMYGPNSPYAQQLRQGLERKDAQGGRRSQYGPREVELQARLADMQTRNAPNILAANAQANTMGQGARRTNAQTIASGIDLGKKSGLFDYAQRGLGELFSESNTGNGNAAFMDSGITYNNPSAYTALEDSGSFWDF